MKDRSTIDAIDIILHIKEKGRKYEYNIILSILFIYFQKAFDKIIRSFLIRVLELAGVPRQIVNLVKMKHKSSSVKLCRRYIQNN